MVSTANAENPVKPETPETPNHPTHKLMDKRVSELMADRVGFKKDMALKELAEINEKAELEARENLMFPADELYGEWTNEWVNPFRGKKVDMPDSCVIDCSTFVLPMDSMTRVTSKYGPRRRRMHKGIDLKVQIGDTIRAAFDGKVRYLVLLGETANKIAECARRHGFENIIMTESLEDAVKVCSQKAESGDAVLLSPACASWDMFKSYEERGRIFKELVHKLAD